MESKKKTFNYEYSAQQQEEVKEILAKYIEKPANELDQLRKLDRKVEMQATMAAIVIGVIGAALLGLGLCFVLVWKQMVWGIIIGMFGIACMGSASPLHTYIAKKLREHMAPQILELSEKLLKP